MKNYLIILLLILSVGFCQRLSEVIETYENGNIKSITYHKKTRDGIQKVKEERYYEKGEKEFEGSYKDGERGGLDTWWYENGLKEREGYFWDGSSDGLWKYWYENGQKKEERIFMDGKLISSKRWNEDGSVKE